MQGRSKNGLTLANVSVIPLIIVSALAVSLSSILIRYSSSSAIQITLYRLAFTTLLVLPFVTWKKQAFPANTRERGMLLLSGLALALHFVFWVSSLWYTSVSESVLLVVSTHPVIVALASSLLFKEHATRRALIGIGTAIFGNAIIVITALGRGDLMGDALAILGGLMFAIYLLIGRSLRQSVSLGNYAMPVYGFAVIVVVIIALSLGASVAVSEPRELGLFFLMALIPGLLGHTLYNYLLKRVRAYVVSVTLLAEPVGASILAILLLREFPRDIVFSGLAVSILWVFPVIIFGIFLVVSERERDERTRE
jgi:drug/metabolite transporter (DMT)-like permease